MRMLLALVAAVALLSGCTPSTQSAFDKACAGATAAYAVYSTEHQGPANTKVEAAWTIASRVCTNPPTDVATATFQVASALYIIARAWRDA